MFGLSEERPTLDHHAKAHIHEIRRISPAEICRISPAEICWISPAEIRRISKDQLPGMVSPMFSYSVVRLIRLTARQFGCSCLRNV